jgi:2-polyprenyl-3-methyl-5-hydroxy-6-metoxy-1,4-benzoquinol methylase
MEIQLMKMKDFYEDEVYKDFKPQTEPRIWQVFALDLLSKEDIDNKKVLDVGAASGFILRNLQNRNIKRYALDLSAKCVSYLNSVGINAQENNISVDPFPFEDDFFDYVIFTEVIEHLPFPEHALSEINRVLKPGGKLLISTHNTFNFYMRMRYVAGVFPTSELDVSQKGQHLRLYNYATLLKVLVNAGLKKCENKSWFSLKGLRFYVPNFMTPFLSRHLLILCTKEAA